MRAGSASAPLRRALFLKGTDPPAPTAVAAKATHQVHAHCSTLTAGFKDAGMTTAFILDPFSDTVDLEGFERLAHERHGWNFNRLSFHESQTDPKAFLPRLFAAAESADILLCFGQYLWIQFGVPGFYERIEQKLVAGTPFFLQFVRLLERSGSQQLEPGIVRLLRRLNVLPTSNKVFNYVDAHSDHSSGGSCWFRKGDGCLVNPQILSGVDKVLIT